MITMDMIGKVRRMKLRDKFSNSAIAKLTGLSRNTVKKWLKAPGNKAPKYSRESSEGKLTAFEETLEQALTADSHRPKHGRRTAKALFGQIQAQGYRGGYSAVTDFTRAWRELSGKAISKAFVPLSFELGEAFQFDWSDEGLLVGGVFYKLQVAHLKLCASRAFWLVAYPSQGHEMLFDAHTRSFQALGRSHPVRHLRQHEDARWTSSRRARGASSTPALPPCAATTCLILTFAMLLPGWEKGVVEIEKCKTAASVSGSRPERVALARSPSSTLGLGERCRSIWADTQHPVHKQFTVAEMLELEKGHLMSMPAPFDGYVQKAARVSGTCLVAVARNRYSVPCEWAGRLVSTRLYPNRVTVAADDVLVASHARLAGSSQTTYDWQHYIDLVQRKPGALRNGAPFLDLPAPLLRLRQSLLRHTGRGPRHGRGAGRSAPSRPASRVGGRRGGSRKRRAQRQHQRRACTQCASPAHDACGTRAGRNHVAAQRAAKG